MARTSTTTAISADPVLISSYQAESAEVKVESTATTFGQDVEVISDSSTDVRSISTGDVDLGEPIEVVLAAPVDAIPYIQEALVAVQVSPVLLSDVIVDFVVQTDVLGEAIDRFGDISFLPCKVQSSIAVAAASLNDGATAVVAIPTTTTATTASRLSTATTAIVSPKGGTDQLDVSDLIFASAASSLTLATPQVTGKAVVKGSSIKSRQEIRTALSEAQKVDLTISLRSKVSEPLEINFLKVPAISTNFVYNFFVREEEDILSQEDQALDPLLTSDPKDVPRYVELKWTPTQVTNPMAGTEKVAQEKKDLRAEVFCRKRGVCGFSSTNFSNSVEKNKKNYNPTIRDGLSLELVDVNNIELGFDSIVNSILFSSSVPVVINTLDSVSVVDSIPLKESTSTTK